MPVVGGEPTGDTAPEETAVPRLAARVVLIDPAGRTLLFRGRDPGRPEAGTWWFPPGGEIEDGETPAEAARREVREETGVLLEDVGEPVRLRETIRDAKVWVMGSDGQPVAGRMDLPEGWFALPVDGEDLR